MENWIEHTLAECPVDFMQMVRVKCRDGFVSSTYPAATLDWSIIGTTNDIVAYQIIEEGNQMNTKEDKKDILSIRDRIYAINEQIAELEEERKQLTAVLKAEGLALLDGHEKEEQGPVVDYEDWKEGDLVTIVGNSINHKFSVGEVVRIVRFEQSGELKAIIAQKLDGSNSWFILPEDAKWHSRPE